MRWWKEEEEHEEKDKGRRQNQKCRETKKQEQNCVGENKRNAVAAVPKSLETLKKKKSRALLCSKLSFSLAVCKTLCPNLFSPST